ncbi:MAG: hypothetical protein KatS3mg050_1209 [Litorilinea sp.]|nr:MAG: hypothetical protein KatS3mg050_1209 [Litorilinea sp.]
MEPSPTPTPTVEPSPTPTPTVEPSPTPTPTVEPSPTPTPTVEPSPTPTPTVEPSPTPTPTVEPSPTPTPTVEPSPTPTPTVEPSPTPTPTVEPSPTPTPTAEPSPTPTPTVEPSPTPTPTVEPSPTPTPTVEPSPTPTPTVEPSPTPTPTVEPSPTPTPTVEPSPTPTPTVEPSPTPTPTVEPSPTPTPTVEPSPTPTPTVEPSPTPTPTVEPSPTPTPTVEPSPTPTPTAEPLPGKVVVVKQTQPEGSTGQFSFAGSFGPFTLGGGQSQAFGGLAPGTYQVAEQTPAGWVLVNATCDDGSTPDAIQVDAGETVTCTFVNRRQVYDLALEKQLPEILPVLRPGDPVTFTLRITNQGELDAHDIVVTDWVRPEDFVFHADANPGWTGDPSRPQRLVPLVPAGQSVSVPIVLHVAPDVDGSRSLMNCAEIQADDGDDQDSTPGNYGGGAAQEDDTGCVEVPATLVEPLNPTRLDPEQQPGIPADLGHAIYLPIVRR